MSVFVGVRLPDWLNKQVEEEAVKQGWSKSATIIGLLAGALRVDETLANPVICSQAVAEPVADPILDSLRQALDLSKPSGGIQVVLEEPEELPMCDYKEWDGEAGEFFGCALRKHGPKTKHVKGEKA